MLVRCSDSRIQCRAKNQSVICWRRGRPWTAACEEIQDLIMTPCTSSTHHSLCSVQLPIISCIHSANFTLFTFFCYRCPLIIAIFRVFSVFSCISLQDCRDTDGDRCGRESLRLLLHVPFFTTVTCSREVGSESHHLVHVCSIQALLYFSHTK